MDKQLRLYRVFFIAEKGEPKSFDIEAVDHYKAIELGMDKCFEEEPDNKFAPAGFEEIEK
jgi:hypothetical protein